MVIEDTKMKEILDVKLANKLGADYYMLMQFSTILIWNLFNKTTRTWTIFELERFEIFQGSSSSFAGLGSFRKRITLKAFNSKVSAAKSFR